MKIRITIPKDVKNILKRDIDDYEINENKLYNLIYENMDFEYNIEQDRSVYKDETELVQFTLSKENYCKYFSPFNLKIKKAKFFRQLLVQYALKSSYERELIIFKKSVNTLKNAIENNRKIKVTFREREDILDAYFIISLEKENRNYLVSYSEYKEMILSYRIKNIRSVEILSEFREIFDEKYIQNLKENFDPFLSYGKKVIVKFNFEGIKHYEKIITNRPKLLEKNGEKWIFEANEYKALLYFCGFMDMVEILEPESLREKMIEKIKKMVLIYDISNSKQIEILKE
ncbi:MAG: WYL domain-containing protein [Cetobacterium sp.]|uniref:WYL domain-containing protein n=1 Tax=Cetobacterium sp. TaxID=2071632 RepID=UPI003F2E92D0